MSTATLTPKKPTRRLKDFIRSGYFLVGGVILFLLVVLALFGQWIAPYDANEQIASALEGPTAAHWLGTDETGRDLLSRILVGTRAALITALGASAVGAILGIPLGMLGGYFGGWLDACLMRLIDFVLALPGILFALVIVAVLGGSMLNLTLAIGIGAFPSFARLARASTISLRDRPYVQAVKTMGASWPDILVHTLLPNVLPPLIVQFVVTSATATLTASGLSFLGLGAPPPDPTWGAMLQSSRSFLYQAPLSGIAPGVALVITVAAFDAVGRGFRDVLGANVSRASAGGM